MLGRIQRAGSFRHGLAQGLVARIPRRFLARRVAVSRRLGEKNVGREKEEEEQYEEDEWLCHKDAAEIGVGHTIWVLTLQRVHLRSCVPGFWQWLHADALRDSAAAAASFRSTVADAEL